MVQVYVVRWKYEHRRKMAICRPFEVRSHSRYICMRISVGTGKSTVPYKPYFSANGSCSAGLFLQTRSTSACPAQRYIPAGHTYTQHNQQPSGQSPGRTPPRSTRKPYPSPQIPLKRSRIRVHRLHRSCSQPSGRERPIRRSLWSLLTTRDSMSTGLQLSQPTK